MQPWVIGIIFIIIMLYFIFTGMNIGLAFLTVGILGYAVLIDFNASIGLLRSTIYTTASTYTFAVIPLFILMGQVAFEGDMTSGLYDAAGKWLGRLPGGLADATIAACALFGAICGSLAATTSTMAKVAVPEMRKHGYQDKLSMGVVAPGGTLGVLIPPSTIFIVYGIAAEQSIGKLFASGVLPGILMALLMMITIGIMVKRNPALAPKTEKYTMTEKVVSLKGLIPMAILFAIIFIGMFGGVFGVNECAAIGSFVAFIIMIIKKKFTKERVLRCLKETVLAYGMVYCILIGAQVLNAFLAASRISSLLATVVSNLNMSRTAVLILIIVIYAILGCFIDSLPMILLTIPIFMPIIQSFGVNLIWFGVIIVMVSQIGAITPPVGTSCYVLSGCFKDTPLTFIFKSILPFLIPMFVSIVIIFLFPQLCTWLPSLVYT